MIEINKSLTLRSSDGADFTVLDASLADVTAVFVRADGVAFGARTMGLRSPMRAATACSLRPTTVAGNVAKNNGSNGNVTFQIDGNSNSVVGNQALHNANLGFSISGEGNLVTDNVASNNLQGFTRFLSRMFTKNAAIGNRTHGVSVNAPDPALLEISSSAIVGNVNLGIRVFDLSGAITKNNIFGNDTIGSNCGVLNTSTSLAASDNFWGASTGPGPDPADAACNDLGGTTIVDPVATKAFKVRFSLRP